MKIHKKAMLAPLLLALLLGGCQGVSEGDPDKCLAGENPTTGGSTAPNGDVVEQTANLTVLRCRIVDGAEEGNLLLAELSEDAPAGVYRLGVQGLTVYLDDAEVDATALRDGMTVDVFYGGANAAILETYPARFSGVQCVKAYSHGSETDPAGGYYDLCGLYLQVLDDLWNTDTGLNSGVTIVGLDLSNAPGGLNASEQSALAWRFGELHGVYVVTSTYAELDAQGCFSPSGWEDGCLFTITGADTEGYSSTLTVLKFNAQKWRAPDGAYFFEDCTALWSEAGGWSYVVGAASIS